MDVEKLDFSKICRTCMKQEENMKNLYENCNTRYCLVEKLMSCTFIQISPDDGLPFQLCSDCVFQINSAYKFAKNCEQVDKKLRQCAVIPKKKPEKPIKVTEIKDKEISDIEITKTNNDIIFYTDHTYDKKISNEIIENMPSTSFDEINSRKIIKLTPPYTCKKCGDKFAAYHELKEHLKMHSTKQDNNTKDRACPICNKILSRGHLASHIRIHTNEKPYCCEFCGRKFVILGNLNRHRKIHTGDKPYKCDFCDKSFIQSNSLKDHRRIHTGEQPFICNFCGKMFSAYQNFRLHIKKHENKADDEMSSRKKGNNRRQTCSGSGGGTDHQCTECQRFFATKATLKTHQLVHGEKKFLCSECGRGFISKFQLNSHSKVHTGVRPYSCKICEKTFSQVGSLNTHNLLHTGQKPFVCDICNRAFTQGHHLKHHLRTHSGERPYSCSVCGKTFALNGNLKVHIRTHTGETPYVCPVCGKGFYDSSSMKKHRKNHVLNAQDTH